MEILTGAAVAYNKYSPAAMSLDAFQGAAMSPLVFREQLRRCVKILELVLMTIEQMFPVSIAHLCHACLGLFGFIVHSYVLREHVKCSMKNEMAVREPDDCLVPRSGYTRGISCCCGCVQLDRCCQCFELQPFPAITRRLWAYPSRLLEMIASTIPKRILSHPRAWNAIPSKFELHFK